MKDLIEALTILMKYLDNENGDSVTHCEHDKLSVMVQKTVSKKDAARLDELGFFLDEDVDEEARCWSSFRFGSA